MVFQRAETKVIIKFILFSTVFLCISATLISNNPAAATPDHHSITSALTKRIILSHDLRVSKYEVDL